MRMLKKKILRICTAVTVTVVTTENLKKVHSPHLLIRLKSNDVSIDYQLDRIIFSIMKVFYLSPPFNQIKCSN